MPQKEFFQSNSKGRLITANRAMVEMLGYSSLDEMQEAIAYHIANIYENSEDRQKVTHHFEAQGTLTGFEVRLNRKDGSGIMAGIECAFVQIRDPRWVRNHH